VARIAALASKSTILDWQRRGFGGRIRTPSTRLTVLSSAL
jgi:hypothetical protein